MTMMNKLSTVMLIAVLAIALITSVPLTHTFAKQSKADKKAEKKIEKALEKYVKDHYSQYCLITATTKKNNQTHTIFDNACTPVPPPPPPPPSNKPPVAKISASKLVANVSDIIKLSGNKSTDSDGNITSYKWTGTNNINFTSTNTTDTQFAFPNQSKVTVNLKVTDNNGSSSSASIQIVKWVAPPPPPPPGTVKAVITGAPVSAHGGDTFQVSAASSEPQGNITAYEWSGSGLLFSNFEARDTSVVFPHTNVSSLTLNLLVTGKDGSTDTASTNITNLDSQNPPPPPPPPSNTTTKIDFTGDVSGTAVRDAIKKDNPDLAVVAGDLGYQSTLNWFKSNYGTVFGVKLKCLVGNHEDTEDGSAALLAATLAYCGDHWYVKTGNGTTLIIGFNSNGDTTTEINYIKSITSDPTIMDSVKTVIVTSHKNGHVPPNSHHPAEASSVYSAVEKISMPGVTLVEVGSHNHLIARASAENWYISGAGGKSHYSCGTSATWDLCNNSVYGYLQFLIDNSNGHITAGFYDTNGNRILK